MRRGWALLVLALVAGAALVEGLRWLPACAHVGCRAPDFSLPAADGGTVRLAEYRGRVTVLNFWATWCPPCLEELPQLAAFHAAAGPEVALIGVDVTFQEPSVEAVRAFLRRHRVAWPTALDVRGEVAAAYRVREIPVTLVIDRRGIIRARHPRAITRQQLEALVRQARDGP